MFPETTQTESLNKMSDRTMVSHLGIEFTEVGTDYLQATMPVDDRTKTPMGLLHGGASVALAETLGSVASTLLIDHQTQAVVGLEINANHVKSAREGLVTATARAVHVGRRTHIWDIRIVNEEDRLVCISRLTTTIIDKRIN